MGFINALLDVKLVTWCYKCMGLYIPEGVAIQLVQGFNQGFNLV